MALSYQEVGIALLGQRGEHYRRLRDFALGLAVAVAACLGLIAFTPLSGTWLRGVAGLSPELAAFAVMPLQIYALLPALSVLQSFQRALLVHGRSTRPLGWATAAEVGTIALVLSLAVLGADMVGAVAAAVATMAGRSVGLAVLTGPTWRMTRRFGAKPVPAVI
jgi:O-antigen/teichoic acid export membrane protein